MFLKIFIVTFILVAFTMLALGVKLLFDKDATFTHHSCALDNGNSDTSSGCTSCGIKEIAHCPEKDK